jgi:hypothetical protein
MIRYFFSSVLLILAAQLNAQNVVRDSSLFDPHVSVSYAFHLPAGEMVDRFGNSHNIGLGFHIKSKTNWYYGVQASYEFGTKVIEPGLLQNLTLESGYIMDNQGQLSKLSIQQRGFMVTADGGYLFDIIGPNKNSGLLVYGGVGFMQHKIRIEHQENEIPQLEGEYLKGYDRLSNGLALHQFVGYYHMSNNRLINFYIGLEAWEGFTQGRRPIYFDTQEPGDAKRRDGLGGIRAGWTLHLYRRMSNGYYYH